MRTTEVNESLIGKRVAGVFTAMDVTGTITAIVDDGFSKGVRIKLDNGVNWGGEIYHEYESTARVEDEWGNLKYTRIIN